MATQIGKRGRPATVKKAEMPLDDGSEVVMRLLGGVEQSVQITLPEQWSLNKFDRALTPTGGRTQITFTKE